MTDLEECPGQRLSSRGHQHTFVAAKNKLLVLHLNASIPVKFDVLPDFRSTTFWKDLPMLDWATSEVPELYDTVSVIGFPTGGQVRT